MLGLGRKVCCPITLNYRLKGRRWVHKPIKASLVTWGSVPRGKGKACLLTTRSHGRCLLQRCMTDELALTKLEGLEDSGSGSEDEDVPLAQRAAKSRKSMKESSTEGEGESESDDDGDDASSDVVLARRAPRGGRRRGRGGSQLGPRPREGSQSRNGPVKRQRLSMDVCSEETGATKRKWDTLEHCGVLFPPEYVPHGVKMLYGGEPVTLRPDQEEIATFFAVMKDTDYAKKPQFIKNFFEGFREVLGTKHTIQKFEKCDFEPIYKWHMQEKERKAALSKEEKNRIKEEKTELEAKYKVALVDGVEEQVGNFRVEPPGLFRGRGEHPKMGKVKRRIYPEDITLNLGEKCSIPSHPFKGRKWKSIVHKHDVTWLAFWKDPVTPKDFKYVWLSANSSFKAENDIEKYEKARKLKDVIDTIRQEYERKWDSPAMRERQMGTALYFIDILALRAGHDKDEDEADTVGCCNLKVSNVTMLPPNKIEFDFLGKDSIQYQNTVEVHPKVYKNVELFKRQNKDGTEKSKRNTLSGDEPQLFDAFDAIILNRELKSLMPGLSAKVFRTYNASITLDGLLQKDSDPTLEVNGKKAEYDTANKEVAILCNHQRAVPKGHEGQMGKLNQKLLGLRENLQEAEAGLMHQGRGGGSDGNLDRQQKKVGKLKERISALEQQLALKEDMKTVALGTSKINYLDPRISVAWCKRNDVPIEKVFPKTLLSKFSWAMTVDPDYRF